MEIEITIESIDEDLLKRNGYEFIMKVGDDNRFMVVDNLGKMKTILNQDELIKFVNCLK